MAVRAGGCILQFRQARALQYIPAILASLNKGWQRRWFYLRNDDGRLPSFSKRVVTTATDNWRYGTPRERQKNLQPLLRALEELREGGLTAAGVVAAIHRRRVLPLTERRLPLWEMTPGVDLEGLQMSSDPLPTDDLHRRVAGTVGVAEPPKLLGPHAPALVSKTSDGYACAPDNLTGSVRVSQGPRINHEQPGSQD
jgi:hypothetical protein